MTLFYVNRAYCVL